MMHVDKVSVTFYLIKNTSTDLSLISKQARVMGGVFFSDTHTKLPSTVIRQIMLSFCINHPINQALIY